MGVVVPGRVVAQPFYVTRNGDYWGDDVRWSFAGTNYDDSTSLTNAQQNNLPPVGETVIVRVDRNDPSWFSLNGVITGRTRSSVSLALFVVPGLMAGLLGIGLGWRGVRLRSVTRRYPWQLATVAEVRRVTQRNGRLRYTESKIVGDDSRLPITVRSLGRQEGKPVWVCLGDRTYAICRPGAFGLRCARYWADENTNHPSAHACASG